MDIHLETPSMWMFINPDVKGPLGYPTGYEIMPGATAKSLLSPDDPPQKLGAFSEHQFWVTPYDPAQRYAAGIYPTSSKGDRWACGLDASKPADRKYRPRRLVHAWFPPRAARGGLAGDAYHVAPLPAAALQLLCGESRPGFAEDAIEGRPARRTKGSQCATAAGPAERTTHHRRCHWFSDPDLVPPQKRALPCGGHAKAPASRSFLRCNVARNRFCSPGRSAG